MLDIILVIVLLLVKFWLFVCIDNVILLSDRSNFVILLWLIIFIVRLLNVLFLIFGFCIVVIIFFDMNFCIISEFFWCIFCICLSLSWFIVFVNVFIKFVIGKLLFKLLLLYVEFNIVIVFKKLVNFM